MTSADRGDRRGPAWERWLAIVLRSLHLAGVVGLGMALIGPDRESILWAARVVLGTGLVLGAMDLRSRRINLHEVAGGFVALKLLLAAWMAWSPAHASAIFWALVLVSSVVSHAPKSVRHRPWWPWHR